MRETPYRTRTLVIALLAASAVALSCLSPWTRSVSREAVFTAFESSVSDMVYEWDPEDRRSDAERRQALFGFMTETFGSSFWVPRSLLDGNLITRAVAGDPETIARERVGLVLWRGNRITPVYGVSPSAAPDSPLGFTSNCAMCHLAEIDGVVYFGAGNKAFDEKALVEALARLTSPVGRRILPGGSEEDAMASRAHAVLRQRRFEKAYPLTRGRSTAFAGSHVEFYLREHGGVLPGAEGVGRGDTKIPPLWHFAAKAPFERWYVDGSFRGKVPLMASSMELFKGRSYEELRGQVVPAIQRQFLNVVQYIRPPRYPYGVDSTLAERGRALFYSREVGCYTCHGVYDGRGNVRWTGTHADVGTDRGRLEVVSEGFVEAFNRSPLSAEDRLAKSEGYAATPLTGVWANYPYLHNGSVPTLFHLLGPEAERPQVFSVVAARRFDPQRVGQRLYVNGEGEGMSEAGLLRRFGEDRDWFNANRPGCGNRGHDVWPRIRTDENRMALIEYLKTL